MQQAVCYSDCPPGSGTGGPLPRTRFRAPSAVRRGDRIAFEAPHIEPDGRQRFIQVIGYVEEISTYGEAYSFRTTTGVIYTRNADQKVAVVV